MKNGWKYILIRITLYIFAFFSIFLSQRHIVATPLLEECEDDTHTLEMGTWESSGTPATTEFDCRGQNTSPWGVFHVIGKLLKCGCRKWPYMSHLDIWSISYGKKKGRESNWQFDSHPLKNWESTRPWCVQMECNTPLESSQQ